MGTEIPGSTTPSPGAKRTLSGRVLAATVWVPSLLLGPWVVLGQDRLLTLESERPALLLAGALPFLLAALIAAWSGAPKRSGLVAALSLVWLLNSWPSASATPRPAARGPSLVLVTLDTFRGDHLSRLGGAALTPNLDKLSQEGAIFTQAISSFPLTAPSHATLLTGRDDHGLHANGGVLAHPTVVPALAAAGYRTGAFISTPVLDRYTGLHRGFDHYDDRFSPRARFDWLLGRSPVSVRPGDSTISRALTWLGERSEPVFLWIHLYDPHAPYLPPQAWLPSKAERDVAKAADQASRRDLDKSSFANTVERGFVASQKLMYRSEITWTDHLVGTIVHAVPADAVLIVVGDHGESLDEHDYYFNHGRNLFEPSLHVPLILRWPGRVAPGTEERRLVGLTTITPTLRLAAGLAPEGETLLDRLDPTAPARAVMAYTPGMEAHRPANAEETEPMAALRGEAFKLVVTRDSQEWYDLQADPGETSPQPVPEALWPAAAELKLRVDAAVPPGDPARLRELGYVE